MTTLVQARTEARSRRSRLNAIRREQPLIRLWDGEWNFRAIVGAEYSGDFTWADNKVAPGVIEIPHDHYSSRWLWDENGRIGRGEKANVFITVDKDGARWSGRMDTMKRERRDDGSLVLVVTFLHDIDILSGYTIWSNPFTPAALQFPRVFLLAGPARWALKLSLFLQILRDQNSFWTLPDDPLNPSSWAGLGMSNWSVVVKPGSFANDLAAGIVWSVLAATWKNWLDAAGPILDDAELSIQVRRFIAADDPQPIAGQTLRNGCLVVDIVDKSGYYTGTANGGTIFDGLVRTVAEFTDDFIDVDEVEAASLTVSGYATPGNKFTHAQVPYVVYYEADETGVQSSAITRKTSSAVQVLAGGHSAPGVNEAISAAIQMAGDALAIVIGIPPIGGMVDTLLAPLYTDVLLAWMSVKSLQRSTTHGWSRKFEYFQEGADRGYTLSSLMVLRAGFWATRSFTTHQLQIQDGAPWLIGDNGKGHFFIGDRVGASLVDDITGRLYVDRVKTLRLTWSADAACNWAISIGDDSAEQDPAIRAMAKIETMMTAVHDMGIL